ncbi:unnamed protein product [Cyclocybe aegerita]|uniref:Uncharacterized protein n=1 Tax=Cyclocybe aegerita TaxID=1973307 RepID=A0A8S0W6H0_CYCAE|nr:unnamed protein product [Cyclocybe aegerita]
MTTLHHSTSTAERRHRSHRYAPQQASYSYSTFNGRDIDAPWRDMTNTFTWVAEQDFMDGGKRSVKIDDWVRDQRKILKPSKEVEYVSSPSRPRGAAKLRREQWEELAYMWEVEAEEWMRQEERARRVAHEREKARQRIQDELRRIDARLQQKREAERLEREEARRKAHSETREKERRDRAKLDKLILDAWANYESRWSSLPSSSELLDFKRTPWPLILPPRNTEDITQDAIVGFLYSPLHSQHQTRKERIRSAQLRWHPDRFRRFLRRVPDAEKAVVEEGVGIVARCLNELMEKEKKRAIY